MSGLEAVSLEAFRCSHAILMEGVCRWHRNTEWDNTVNNYAYCSLERMRIVSHLQVARSCLPTFLCDLHMNTTGPSFACFSHSSSGGQVTP